LVTQLSVETLIGRKAHMEMWDEEAYQMNHIELSRNSDLIVAAPATADFIAKMVRGEGNDLTTTIMLAKNKPVILAPSMNVEMWENPAFQRNLETVRADGATIVPPQLDELACGEVGIGKMAEPETIFESIVEHFETAHALDGKRAIVTTGGTIERLDTVRYISNFSSGKQGKAIALALAKAGAKVSLVAGGNCSRTESHPNLETIFVESAEEMSQAVIELLPADIFVACAAVCDFKVVNRNDRKIKKSEGLNLEFAENPDIVASIGNLPSDERPTVVVGFAAETENLIDNAKSKRIAKGCDLVVANEVDGGAIFGQDTNQASFVSASGVEALDRMSKTQLGRRISDWITDFLKH